MTKRIVLGLVVLVALFAAGCAVGSSGGGNATDSVATFDPLATTATTTASSSASSSSGSTTSASTTQTQPPPKQPQIPSPRLRLHLIKVITGHITPKSVDSDQNGLVFAQNMVYTHTVTVYNSHTMKLVKTIPDTIRPSEYGYKQYPGTYQGGPVEAAFSPDKKFVYVSNYQMYGGSFTNPGNDTCTGTDYDPSFVYKISTSTFKIVDIIKVGSVPKYLAVSPDGRYLVVSNWCSQADSIVSLKKDKEIHRIYVGPYPRGIAINKKSSIAYVAVMGSDVVAAINLHTWQVHDITVGSNPRHLVLSPTGRYLYITLNASGEVAKYDLQTGHEETAETGSYTRSLTISGDGESLYVVNYESSTIAKVRASDMKVLQTLPTDGYPIGITYDDATQRLWVSCYSGAIMVFADKPQS